MAKKSKNQKSSTGTIALNKRAKFEYHLDQRIEAGLVLTGWEIKSIRDGRANLVDSYVVATALYWKGHRVKCEIALAKGKQLHDKRATEKDRDWSKQKHRILMKA